MSDGITFDLTKEKWLPCLDLHGKPIKEQLSLRDVFAEAHHISAIQGDSPLVTIALYRFLLAVLYHAIYLVLKRPTRVEDWQSLWEQEESGFDMSPLDDYFQRFNDRFDLFHPMYPFYQSLVAMGDDSSPKSVAELIPEISWGNNATLLDHRFERDGFSLSPAEATRRLIAMQAFGLQGLSGFKKKNYRNASLVDSVVLLAQGNTVFETLMLNLQSPYPARTDSKDSPSWDSSNLPEWEDTRSADNEDGYTPRGLLDYLTWQNRLVLLKPPENRIDFVIRKMKMSRGYKLKLDEAEFDPLKSYTRKKKKGQEVLEQLRWDEHRALWRDSTTLFSVHVEGKERPPRAFKFISDLMLAHGLPLEVSHRYRFSAFGLSPQQASVNFFRHETFPLPLEYLRNPEAFQKLKDNMAYAEEIGGKLEKACSYIKVKLYPGSDKPSKTTQKARTVFTEDVKRRYWIHLQTLFFPMMVRTATEDKTRDQETTQWQSQVNTTVQIAFDEAMAGLGSTAKAFKLYVRGYERIWGNPTKRKKKGDDEKVIIGEIKSQGKRLEQARRFIAYLQRLKAGDKGSGAMAEMRHALNHSAPPETQPMFKYIARWMNAEEVSDNDYLIQPLCLIASLFALHPESVNDESNMGTHLAKLCSGPNRMAEESVERRFNRLLETSFEELPDYLAQIIRLLKSREQKINYARLLADVQQWNELTYANQVKRQWAREFWFRVTSETKSR